ncbi:Sec1 family domain containing protein [Entamoeba marina]
MAINIKDIKDHFFHLISVFDEKPFSVAFKILLVDYTSLKVINSLISKKELINHGIMDVYQIDNIKEIKERFMYASVICLLTPISTTINFLCEELNQPHFKEYALIFTQTHQLSKDDLLIIRRNDIFCCVEHIMCTDLDWLYVTPNIFKSTQTGNVASLSSFLNALSINPTIVTQTTPHKLTIFSNEIVKSLESNKNIDNDSVLIVVDRGIDGYGPLYPGETFLSLLHEYIEIDQSKVVIDNRNDSSQTTTISLDFSDTFLNSNYLIPFWVFVAENKERISSAKQFFDPMTKGLRSYDCSVGTTSIEPFLQNTHDNLLVSNFQTVEKEFELFLSACSACFGRFQNQYTTEEFQCFQKCDFSKADLQKDNIRLAATLLNEKRPKEGEVLCKEIVKKCGKSKRPFEIFDNAFMKKRYIPGVVQLISHWNVIFTEAFQTIRGTLLKDIKEYKTIIIWINGGVTLHEEYALHQHFKLFDETKALPNIILCGDELLNSSRFKAWLTKNQK